METLFNLQSSIFGSKSKFAMNLHTLLARTQANIQIQHVYLTAYVQLVKRVSVLKAAAIMQCYDFCLELMVVLFPLPR